MAVTKSESDPLLPKVEEQDNLPPECRYKFYTLPSLRFVIVVQILLFIDAIAVTVLWLCGGNSKYFVDNILDFHFKESVFDLSLITAAKLVLLILLYNSLENTSLNIVDRPRDPPLNRAKNLLHFFVIFISLAVLAYSAVKGGFILYAFLLNKDYQGMHPAYYAAVICCFAFSFLEFILSFLSFGAMRALKVQRILHRLNGDGKEIDQDGKPIKRKADLRRLASLAKPEACLIGTASFCLLISSAAQTAAPLFFGYVIDAAQRSMDALNQTVVILLLIYVGGSIASTFRSWLFTLAGQRLVARLRKDLFTSIIRQDIAFFDMTRTGELTNRLASDTQVIQNAITVNISMLSRYLVQILGSLILMFILNASLTGVLLAVVPIVSIGAVQYGRFVMKLRKDFQDRLADASTTAEENISSIRTVRSFVGEEKASGIYGVDIDNSYKVGKKLALFQGLFDGTIGMVAYGAISLVLWYGGKLVHDGVVTPGLLTSFLLYTLQVAMAFALLSSLYGDFMQAVGASVRVFDLLDRKPEVPNEGGQIFISMEAAIQFDSVHFTYPSRPDTTVLKDVSFSVEQGKMVALVGPSGGGKSTMVSLIERFYDVDSGSVRLGGDDIRNLDPQWFRRQIALVSQEPTLFACSIRDNIAYGKTATEEEIIEAARQANAHSFIQTFEEGYDTLVGERGVRLSGGQKQRVAIARALIMNPAILLLDEATSALDAESEHLVQEAIDRAMVNRTVLVIAHRLSTVRNASKVVVIDKGRIVEEGNHEELLAKNGVYKKLILRQLTAGSADGGELTGGLLNGDSTESDPPQEVTDRPEKVTDRPEEVTDRPEVYDKDLLD